VGSRLVAAKAQRSARIKAPAAKREGRRRAPGRGAVRVRDLTGGASSGLENKNLL